MRSTLYLKFAVIYIIFGFLSLFTTATLTSELVMNHLEKEATETLYREASLLSTEYLPGYFSNSITETQVIMQLDGLETYLGASAWFVDNNGKMLSYANTGSTTAPSAIKEFNPIEFGAESYAIGNYHGYFTEDVISVISPVTKGFSLNGYLLLHKPLSSLDAMHHSIMNSFYITLGFIYVFSFIIFLGMRFFIYRPLRQITEAAKQYASGNLDHEIPINTEDEIGYLSASLNYMSSQLRDMKDYQKKFVANVSHDFRSPLTSIKGYVEAMADGTIPPEFQEKYLKIILFETERLTDLTSDLLTLNEFDTKHLLLDRSNFDIHDMIRNTAGSFEGTCTQKKISIELLMASQTLPVYADRRKIQQVLYNLLDNAIKFSNTNSSITIETTERNDKVYISVKDYGIGIPKKSLGKIWERFYKTDLSRGKDKKGTGLGLAIVKEIINAHGENINVVSTEGVGTEFTFSLPKRPAGSTKE